MINEEMARDYNDAPTIVAPNESHMACLFLVDTSGSMSGEPIAQLNEGLRRFKEQVCEDKTTQKVLDVAIVQFNSTVSMVMPFTPIKFMEHIPLEANGGTNMGEGLKVAIDMIDERYRFYLSTGSTPYCPWIVMITDGYPNDPENARALGETIHKMDEENKLRLWSLAVDDADTAFLNELGYGKRVLKLRNYDFTSFFDWVNKSMRSISVSSPGEAIRPVDLPENVDKAIDQNWM